MTQTHRPGRPADVTVRRYDRNRDLPRLVALWPAEIADTSEVGRLRLLARLRAALRRERQRGIGGHWCYDLARHAQLLAAYKAEVDEVRSQRLRNARPNALGRTHDARAEGGKRS